MGTGLLLIDIQNDYFPGGRMELVGMNEASQKASELLSLFRDQKWQTFHIRHIAAQPKATFFLPGTRGAEIHERVKPLPHEPVIEKHYPNAFRETPLLEQVKKAGISRVVICGAMSHMCIDATTRAAADFGLECTVIQDACAARALTFTDKTIPAEHVHGAFMAALASAYARVVSLSEFIAGMDSDS